MVWKGRPSLAMSLPLVIHTWNFCGALGGSDASHLGAKKLLSLPDSCTGSLRCLVACMIIVRVTWIHMPANHCCIRNHKDYRHMSVLPPTPPPHQISAEEVDRREATFLHVLQCGLTTGSESLAIEGSSSWARAGRLDGGSGWLQEVVTEARVSSQTVTEDLGVHFRWNGCPDHGNQKTPLRRWWWDREVWKSPVSAVQSTSSVTVKDVRLCFILATTACAQIVCQPRG